MSHETCVINTATPSRGFSGLSLIVRILAVIAVVLSSAVQAYAGESTANLKMVILGDSLVAGYGLAPGEDFPARLQKAVDEKGIALTIENAGVSGDTSTGGLARLDWAVGDDTDIVLIELGGNDALRGIPPDITRSNLETMITRLKDRNIAVMLAGMQAPPNMGDEYAASFNPIYPELATAYSVPLYPFFLEGVAARTDLNQADGFHPNAEGVDVIVKRFLPFLEENLPEN